MLRYIENNKTVRIFKGSIRSTESEEKEQSTSVLQANIWLLAVRLCLVSEHEPMTCVGSYNAIARYFKIISKVPTYVYNILALHK